MSYLLMAELGPLMSDLPDAEKLELKYPFLWYASHHVLKHAEQAHVRHISQKSFIQQLSYSDSAFQRIRVCHDAFPNPWSRGVGYGADAKLLSVLSLQGLPELVQIMLLSGEVDINAQYGKFGSVLQAAALSDNNAVAVMQQLLGAGADVNIQGGLWGTALQAAAFMGNDAIIQQLLEAGADVNIQDGYYNTALQAAAYMGHNVTVQQLLDAGADVNIQGGYYGTALQAASYYSGEAMVQQLLEAGADVNIQGGQYGTALQAAVSMGNDAIIQQLREAGAAEMS